MNILICPDSFKGSISGIDVCKNIKSTIEKLDINATFTLLPLGDGGEGTKDILIHALKGKNSIVKVCNPLFEDIFAEYGLINESIIIESASPCGLPLVPIEKRNPLNVSSYGVGLLIKEALKTGKKHIILTLGGIATIDCGIGCMSALGVKFFDKNHKEVSPTGAGLGEIAEIDDTNILPEAKEAKWTILCDVYVPLCGENGTVHKYGTQKGATEEIKAQLNNYIDNYCNIIENKYNIDLKKLKYGGAAGGFSAGLYPFFNIEYSKGIDYILKLIDFDTYVKNADLIITGEGRVDNQTLDGKVISGVLKHAKEKPVIIVGGSVTEDGYKLAKKNVKVFSLSEGYSVEDSINHPKEYIEKKITEIYKEIL